jgi:hypothetical protein
VVTLVLPRLLPSTLPSRSSTPRHTFTLTLTFPLGPPLLISRVLSMRILIESLVKSSDLRPWVRNCAFSLMILTCPLSTSMELSSLTLSWSSWWIRTRCMSVEVTSSS